MFPLNEEQVCGMMRGCTNQQRQSGGLNERGLQNPPRVPKSNGLSAARGGVSPSAPSPPGPLAPRQLMNSHIHALLEEEVDELDDSEHSPELDGSGDVAEVDELESSCEELEELIAPPKAKAKRHISETADGRPPKQRRTTLSQAARDAILGSSKAENSVSQQVRNGPYGVHTTSAMAWAVPVVLTNVFRRLCRFLRDCPSGEARERPSARHHRLPAVSPAKAPKSQTTVCRNLDSLPRGLLSRPVFNAEMHML